MTNNLNIRATTSADLPSVASIAEATGLFPAEMLPNMIAGYLNGDKPDIWLTVDSSDGVIGFAFCEPERLTNGTWNLLAIAVAPGRQSNGVGAALLHRLEDLLRAVGHRILLVETLGTPEYARTRNFYLDNGFSEEARIRDFYEVGGDKIVYCKRL